MHTINEIAREVKKQNNNAIGSALFNSGNVLGTITPTMKLKLDNFKHELDFMQIQTSNHLEIAPSLLGGVFWYSSKYDIGQDAISVKTTVKLNLEPGDRVLVSIVNNGADHVVIGLVE